MALEDAVVLAESLDAGGSLDDRLRAFEQRRYPRAKLVQDVSRAILETEMGINADNYDHAVQAMRDHLPEQNQQVDRLLDAPA